MSEYYVYWQEGLKAVNNKTYYINADGMVRTDPGVVQYKGAYYYILPNASGVLQTSVGFTPDHKYFIPATDGKIRTAQGTFSYGGKTYYSGAGGVIPSAPGLYSVGNTQYFVNADGSVKTDA